MTAEPMNEETHIFTASRWTRGNRLFPVRLEISPSRVTMIRPSLFGANEESIAIPKVASVNIQTGMMWADIRIDSTGGTNPMVSHCHSKEDARAIRDLIERLQQSPASSSIT